MVFFAHNLFLNCLKLTPSIKRHKAEAKFNIINLEINDIKAEHESSSLSPFATDPGKKPACTGRVQSDVSLRTVLSDWKAIVGLRRPVALGIHTSTEISKTSHPRDLKILPLVRHT